MVDIIEKEKCCGCKNCESICGTRAIQMVNDSKGFVYPGVDSSKCIGCGLCESVCPILTNIRTMEQCRTAYAYKRTGLRKRMRSQSGGAFASLAEYLLKSEPKSSVFGVVLDSNLRAVYKRVTDISGLERMLGSKYVQADMARMQKQIAEDLKNGYTVLVCGTPCFIDAVKKYVECCGLPNERLILVDFICHGVMSPMMYSDYIEWLEKRTGRKIVNFRFREKRIDGWGGRYSVAKCSRGVSLATKGYLDAFHRDAFHRDACYACKYNSYSRCSDITIGDYWTIGNCNKAFYDTAGISCVLGVTEKGRRIILEVLPKQGTLLETSMKHTKQRPLVEHLARDENEDEQWNKYLSQGFAGIIEDDTVIKFWRNIPLTTDIRFLRSYIVNYLKNSWIGIIIRKVKNR